MKEFDPPRQCTVCGDDFDEVQMAYGDCPVCEQFVCEGCDEGYDPATGQMVCPEHAADPRAAGCTE